LNSGSDRVQRDQDAPSNEHYADFRIMPIGEKPRRKTMHFGAALAA
jgi:hypothetical protein